MTRRFSFSMMLRVLCLAFVLLVPGSAPGLSPHEVLVLVNRNSPESMEIANHFCSARGVPLVNRVDLDLPPAVARPSAEISPAQFQSAIWDPVQTHVKEHTLGDHILAWVYSVDFPVRISSTPKMSLHGLTLLRGQVPDQKVIDAARYISPFYAGPDEPGGKMVATHSLSRTYFKSLDNIPVPSMSLGHIGARGVLPSQVISNIYRGVASDHTRPEGHVLLVANDNIRSTCRTWQFEGVVRELRQLGIPAETTRNVPAKASGVLGLLTGESKAPPGNRKRFVPGAIAEHLTSHAANFKAFHQGKISAWIHQGATATAGTVDEPYALWPKFAHARLFAHYARGCSVLESYVQSVRCPLQLYLAGDPLAVPFAPRILLDLELAQDADDLRLTSSLAGDPLPIGAAMTYSLFLDDRLILDHLSALPKALPVNDLPDGYHSLRVVGEVEAPVRHSAVAEASFMVERSDRAIAIRNETVEPLLLGRTYDLSFEPSGEPLRIYLVSGSRILDTAEPEEAAFRLHTDRMGAGPGRVQAVAEYADGERVASAPLPVSIKRPPAPDIRFEFEQEDGVRYVRPSATTMGETNAWEWFRIVAERGRDGARIPEAKMEGGTLETNQAGFLMRGENPAFLCTVASPGRKEAWKEIRAGIQMPRPGKSQIAGLAFNVRSRKTFDFFGAYGRESAWVFASVRSGTLEIHESVGRYIPAWTWHDLSVREGPDGLEGLVNGRTLCRWPGGELGTRPTGLMVKDGSLTFRNWMVGPLSRSDRKGTVTSRGLTVGELGPDALARIACVAWNDYAVTWKPATGSSPDSAP